MAGLEGEFCKLNLLNNRSSRESDSFCPHQDLIKIVADSYQCKQCHQQCRVTFECSSSSSSASSSPESEVLNVSLSVDEEESQSTNQSSSSIQFESYDSSKQFNDPNSSYKSQTSTSSRLLDEFEYLNVILGQGGYGSVGKFKNVKDEKIYAVKKTKATERNEREVKVFSNLHHNNIVRYYNCWTEPSDSSFPKSAKEEESSNTDEEEEEMNESSAVLYIQMEFCEHGTLREVIDSGDFVRDRFRMWMLFRQLVEGVKYFHKINIIHRDLKPKNVFLKSHLCVKIGDFGLATAHSNSGTLAAVNIIHDESNNSVKLTTECGTSVYRAPEVATGKYDTKADMYSLGIIFFEMYHAPFDTEMERRKELTKLRESDYESLSHVVLASIPDEEETYHDLWEETPFPISNMREIIVKLLDPNPKTRPSAQELLKSPQMPPPLLDKLGDFLQLLESILLARNKDSRPAYFHYIRIMELCLQQNTTEDQIFNWLYNIKRSSSLLVSRTNNSSMTIYRHHSFVMRSFIRRCQDTGAQYFQPSTLLPKISTNKKDYSCEELRKLAVILENETARSFIDYDGTLAVLPVNSYTSFAHHIASYGLIELKRFCIQQVYKYDFDTGKPPEPSNTELALDIVSEPSSTSKTLRQADAEVVKVFERILIRDYRLASCVQLQLNHHLLIKAILIYFKVPLDQRSKRCRKLAKKFVKLDASSLSDPIVRLLSHQSSSLSGVKAYLDSLPDWIGSESATLADEAFKELGEIIKNLSRANNWNGLSCPIVISLRIGLDYYDTHSGFLFSFISEWRNIYELAKGGRYDGLVQSFLNVMVNGPNTTELRQDLKRIRKRHQELADQKQHVVGGAVHLNNVVIAIGKQTDVYRPYK